MKIGKISRLPHSRVFCLKQQNGCIVLKSRNEDVASWLIGGHKNAMGVGTMAKNQGLDLLMNETQHTIWRGSGIGSSTITQTTACINRLGGRAVVAKYLEQFHRSEKSKANLLKRDTGDIRQNTQASHSVIVTWQVSFD